MRTWRLRGLCARIRGPCQDKSDRVATHTHTHAEARLAAVEAGAVGSLHEAVEGPPTPARQAITDQLRGKCTKQWESSRTHGSSGAGRCGGGDVGAWGDGCGLNRAVSVRHRVAVEEPASVPLHHLRREGRRRRRWLPYCAAVGRFSSHVSLSRLTSASVSSLHIRVFCAMLLLLRRALDSPLPLSLCCAGRRLQQRRSFTDRAVVGIIGAVEGAGPLVKEGDRLPIRRDQQHLQ